MIYCQFNALTGAILKLEHNSRKRRYIFPKSVSVDPAEELGAKNSISPKNDLGLRSFCTNVSICKIREFKIARKIEIIENRTNNRKC